MQSSRHGEVWWTGGEAGLRCAPTGRAAKRMSEATGFEAGTIHRLREVNPKGGGFKRDSNNSLDCDLLVLDEASMVDVTLMHALMKAVPEHAALLIVGDIDQLPSGGPGQVLADIIASGAIPVVRLAEEFRQAAASRIIVNAHRINQGHMPDLGKPEESSDFYFAPPADPETAVVRIVELAIDRSAAILSRRIFARDVPEARDLPVVVNTNAESSPSTDRRGRECKMSAAKGDSGMTCALTFLVRSPGRRISAASRSTSDHRSDMISSRRAAVSASSWMAGPKE